MVERRNQPGDDARAGEPDLREAIRSGLPTRSGTWTTLIAVVLVALVAGLLLPFVLADPPRDAGGAAPTLGGAERGVGLSDPLAPRADQPDADAPDAPDPSGTGTPDDPDPGRSQPTGLDDAPRRPAAPSKEDLRATDVGVSSDAIRLGVLGADLGGLGNSGFGIAAGDQELQWRTYVDEINETGGVNGRRLEVAYERFDPLSAQDMRRACIAVTEQRKAFAVGSTGGYWGDPVLCIVEQHRTPFFTSDGQDERWYHRAGWRMFSSGMSTTRMLRNQAFELHRAGILQKHKIGILDVNNVSNKAVVDAGLLPTLKQLGYEVTHRATLSSDAGTAQSQFPVAVQQMKSKGVGVVLLVANFLNATQFVQNAESQLFFPLYATSDMAAGTANFYGERMPRSFEGAVGITTTRVGEVDVGRAEPAPERRCREIYERRNDVELDRAATEYGTIMTTCALVRLFERAAADAGADLTRERYAAALGRIGRFQLATREGGSFGPRKLDAPDSVRTVQWHGDCTCWLPVDEFRAARF